MRMIAQRISYSRVQIGACFACVFHELQLVQKLEIGNARRRPNRVRRIGPAMADGSVFVCALLQHSPHFLAHNRARKRRISRRKALGDGDEIRLHPVVFRAKHRSETAKTCDNFIRHQQNIMALKNFLNSRPVALRRRHNAPRAKHRLTNKRCDRVSPFTCNQRFKLGHTMCNKLSFSLLQIVTAEIIGRFSVHHLRKWQIKLLVKQLKPRKRARHKPGAVISAPTADDLFLLGTA